MYMLNAVFGWDFSFFLFSVEGSAEEGMKARPVYVAAVDLSCKFGILHLGFFFLFSC